MFASLEAATLSEECVTFSLVMTLQARDLIHPVFFTCIFILFLCSWTAIS